MKRTSRQHLVSCDAELAARLGQVVAAYAEAAYPRGGSECSQVAHETLLDTARLCAAHGGGELALPRRQLAMLRAAVDWAAEQTEPATANALQALVAGRQKA
jgi:hypothetical protein